MGQALYRKYRSKSLDEIVGQEHITDTLRQALKTGRISHAYLFTGPRGTGKTSIARILAHEINQLSYSDGANHLDIIEIDAASNRRIDEIRDLRDKVYIAPAQAKYKVYIIDEVHMLTKEAFNALLKTLEEPPAHVVFILATTEVHKLPATIVSRTQRYVFRPVEQPKVVAHLKNIAKSESITISDDALQLLAEHGEGSFRDSISLLDQTGNYGNDVSLETVQNMLGVVSSEGIRALLAAVANNQKATVIQELQQLAERGYPAAQIAKQVAAQLRSEYVAGTAAITDDVVLKLLTDLIEVQASAEPDRLLEIVCLRAITAPAAVSTPAAQPVRPAIITPVVTPVAAKPAPRSVPTIEPVIAQPKPAPVIVDEPVVAPIAASASGEFDIALWPDVVAAARTKYNTLHSLLKTAQPVIEDGRLKLCVKFAFHQKRVNEAKNRQIVSDLIKSVTGLDVAFDCVVADKNQPVAAPLAPAAAPVTAAPDSFANVSNIFGGGEVVQ